MRIIIPDKPGDILDNIIDAIADKEAESCATTVGAIEITHNQRFQLLAHKDAFFCIPPPYSHFLGLPVFVAEREG